MKEKLRDIKWVDEQGTQWNRLGHSPVPTEPRNPIMIFGRTLEDGTPQHKFVRAKDMDRINREKVNKHLLEEKGLI